MERIDNQTSSLSWKQGVFAAATVTVVGLAAMGAFATVHQAGISLTDLQAVGVGSASALIGSAAALPYLFWATRSRPTKIEHTKPEVPKSSEADEEIEFADLQFDISDEEIQQMIIDAGFNPKDAESVEAYYAQLDKEILERVPKPSVNKVLRDETAQIGWMVTTLRACPLGEEQ